MVDVLFWLSVLLLVYVYVGYPRLIAIIARICKWEVMRAGGAPSVSVVVAAYNEEVGIAAKLGNVLALDYPAGQLEVIVASDASSDRTDEIVKAHPSLLVRLHRVEGRVGKTACQNSAVGVANGEIIVFTDATTRLETDCVSRMVENFKDSSIGCVAGALQYVAVDQGGVAQGGKAYWDYELGLRRSESAAGGLIGVSGCLYAVRRSAYVPIRPDLISDFCIAMRMREQGLRTVLDERAVCYEDTLDRIDEELSMRVRVAIRSLRAMRSEASFLNPFRYGLFAFQLCSHKMLRYLSPYLWMVALASNLALLHHPFYVLALVGQLSLLASGSIGFFAPGIVKRWKLLSKPYYFLLTNVASVVAFARVLRGERMVTWRPVR